MTSLKKILCCFALIAITTASQANAWHGHGFGGHGFAGHGFGHSYGHGYGGYGFSGHGYGFGLNHQSFYPSIYNPGWSSYSRASFYSSYGYAGLGYGGFGYGGLGYRGISYGVWPRTSFYYRSYAPVYYTNYSYYTPTYFAPTYYPQPCYSTYVTPVIYSSAYSGFPSCAVTPSVNSLPVAAYTVKKPVTSAVPFRLASQPTQPIQGTQFQSPVGRYVLAQPSTSALDTAPEELIAAADAILAAGGYRQAAQAYAQIVVKHGNSDRLVTRRFVAQVANGDYEQAAVVVELAAANGNQINPGDLPNGDLQLAVGNSNGLIASRSEGLAANALQKSDDAVPMLAVAHWLALSGDNERANLFKARAEQMKQVEVGKLISKPISVVNDAN